MPHDRPEETPKAQTGEEDTRIRHGHCPRRHVRSGNRPPPAQGPEAPPLTISKRFEHLLNNPDLYAAVKALPPPSRVGRPALHPPIAYLIFLCAISLFGSARATAAHFEEAMWWDVVCRGIRTHMGDAAADTLQSTGPTRGQWNYFFHNKLKPVFAEVRDASRDLWIQQALDHGMMKENGKRVSRSYPQRHQVIHADATVACPPSSQQRRRVVDKVTGEVREHRVDADASYTVEGGGTRVYGNKFLSAAVRLASTPHSRVILGIDSIRHKSAKRDPLRDDEGTAFIKLTRHILAEAPALRAITYDTALRGVHRAPLIADGLVVFTTQHGGLAPESLKRLEYDEYKCRHDLYVAEGRVCERRMTVDGITHYTPLPVQELQYRPGKQARYYHRVTIHCPEKIHTEYIQVDETDEDRQIDPSTQRQRFNRTEHLRQVPRDTTPAAGSRASVRTANPSTHASTRATRTSESPPTERTPLCSSTSVTPG